MARSHASGLKVLPSRKPSWTDSQREWKKVASNWAFQLNRGPRCLPGARLDVSPPPAAEKSSSAIVAVGRSGQGTVFGGRAPIAGRGEGRGDGRWQGRACAKDTGDSWVAGARARARARARTKASDGLVPRESVETEDEAGNRWDGGSRVGTNTDGIGARTGLATVKCR